MATISERLRSQQVEVVLDVADEAAAMIDELQIEIEAAKLFGGGFYGETVTEATREVYRREAALSLARKGG